MGLMYVVFRIFDRIRVHGVIRYICQFKGVLLSLTVPGILCSVVFCKTLCVVLASTQNFLMIIQKFIVSSA